MLNMRGIALFGALYKFFHYILSPISAFDALDMRLTDRAYTRTVLPAILTTHYATYFGAFLASNESRRQNAGHLWALFPLWISLAQTVAVRGLSTTPSIVSRDRLYNVTSDMPAIRRTVMALVAVSIAAWQYAIWCRPGFPSLADVFLPVLPIPNVTDLGLDNAYVEFLKWDWAFFAVGNIVWIALLAWDLKAAGMVRSSWLALVACSVALALVGGPGALVGLAWLYREEILVSRRHKDAVVLSDDQKEVKCNKSSAL